MVRPLLPLEQRRLRVVRLRRLMRVELLILRVLLQLGRQLLMLALQTGRIPCMCKQVLLGIGGTGCKSEALIRRWWP